MNELNSRTTILSSLAMFYDYFELGYSQASVALEHGWKKGVVGDWGFLSRSNFLTTLLLALVWLTRHIFCCVASVLFLLLHIVVISHFALCNRYEQPLVNLKSFTLE